MRRWLILNRRLLVAAAAGLSVLALAQTITSALTARTASTAVWVTRHDLPAGALLRAQDVEQASWHPGTTPRGLLAEPVGMVTTSAIRQGEALTDARATPVGLAGQLHPGQRLIALPVRAEAAALIHTGMRVDLFAAPAETATGPGEAELTGEDVLVMNTRSASTADDASLAGGVAGITDSAGPAAAWGQAGEGVVILIVCVTPQQAERLSAATVRGPLSAALRPVN